MAAAAADKIQESLDKDTYVDVNIKNKKGILCLFWSYMWGVCIWWKNDYAKINWADFKKKQ